MPSVTKARLSCEVISRTFIRVGDSNFYWRDFDVFKEENIGAEYYDYHREMIGRAETPEQFQDLVLGYFAALTANLTNAINASRKDK